MLGQKPEIVQQPQVMITEHRDQGAQPHQVSLPLMRVAFPHEPAADGGHLTPPERIHQCAGPASSAAASRSRYT